MTINSERSLHQRFRDAEPVPVEAPSLEARLLALAYAIEVAVEDGRFRSVAEGAALLGLSRSRLSQVMRRRWAPVEKQEQSLLRDDSARAVRPGRAMLVPSFARIPHRSATLTACPSLTPSPTSNLTGRSPRPEAK